MLSSWIHISRGKFAVEVNPQDKFVEVKIITLYRKQEVGSAVEEKNMESKTSLMFTNSSSIDHMITALKVAKHNLEKMEK